MSKAIRKLKREGMEIPDEAPRRLSPYRNEHINLLGEYTIDIPNNVPRQHTKLSRLGLLPEICHIEKYLFGHFYTDRDRTSCAMPIGGTDVENRLCNVNTCSHNLAHGFLLTLLNE